MRKRKNIIIIFALCILSCAFFGVGCSLWGGTSEEKPKPTSTALTVLVDQYQLEVGSTQNILVVSNDEEEVIYRSEDVTVAKVNPNGVVTGVGAGNTYITVSKGEETVICKVTVTLREYSVVIGYTNVNLVVGSKFEFNAQLLQNEKPYEGSISWSVSNPDKCTLQKEGASATFSATETGDFTLTATSDKASASCNIKVVDEASKKIAEPILSIKNCDKITWEATTGASGYAVSVNGGVWLEINKTEYSVAELSNALLNGETIDVKVKALARGNYAYIDSYISSVIIQHDYTIEELEVASCTQSGAGKFTCGDCNRTYTDNQYFRPHVFNQNICENCNQERTPVLIYLYDEDRDCYYVAGVKDPDVSVVYVAGYYDDGTHGKKEVTYLGESCFYANNGITHLILPETVKILYEHCCHAMQDLEYIYMPGVSSVSAFYYNDEPINPKKLTKIVEEGKEKSAFEQLTDAQKELAKADYSDIADIEDYDNWTTEQVMAVEELHAKLRKERMTGTNQFQNVFSLKTIVIQKDLVLSTQVFAHNKEARDPIASLYVLEKGGRITTGGHNSNLLMKDESGKIKQTFYAENGRCGTWHFAEDGYTVVETDANHLFGEEGVCVKCGAIDTLGINYDYDAEVDAYYVSGIQDGYVLEPNANGDVVVQILNSYDDGVHDAKPVLYLGTECFKDNKVITHIVLPESVTELKTRCFWGMKNLVSVDLGGVTEICCGENQGAKNNQFFRCDSLTTVIIQGNLKIEGQVFNTDTSGVSKQARLYAKAAGTIEIADLSTTNKLFANVTPVYYNEAAICGSGEWKYSTEYSYLVVVPTHNYENNKCTECNTYNTQGIEYAWDGSTYYVKSVIDASVARGKVEILGLYDDGTNGERAVTYLGASCFSNNTTITHLILPESVTTIKQNACSLMSNLEYVKMLGVSSITSGGNQFLRSAKLSTIIVKKGLNVTVNCFFWNSGSTYNEAYMNFTQVYAMEEGGQLTVSGFNVFLKEGVVVQGSAVCGSNTWKYAEDGYTVISAKAEHSYVSGVCEHCNTKEDNA